MPTHDPHDPNHPQHPEVDSPGYEVTDVNVNGIVVFLASLAAFVGVFFVVCFGMGKVINTTIIESDGPSNQWNKIGPQPRESKRDDLTSNAVMEQQKLREMVQRFPTPRLQTDDGNQEIADLHAKEDLLLNNYSWADQSQGKVRIPIDKAIELLAQRGLPVAAAVEQAPLLTGDVKPVAAVPLTNGFARTGYEHDRAIAEAAEARQAGPQK